MALEKDFKEFGIVLDSSGKDICRLRIYSWDQDGYFNHSAVLYTKLIGLQPNKPFSRPPNGQTREKVEQIIIQIKQYKIDITQAYKEEWLKIALSLFNEFGEMGRGYFHDVSMFHPKYDSFETDKIFDNVLKHNYSKVTIASFFQIASNYGIKLKLTEQPLIVQTSFKKVIVESKAVGNRSKTPEIGSFLRDNKSLLNSNNN